MSYYFAVPACSEDWAKDAKTFARLSAKRKTTEFNELQPPLKSTFKAKKRRSGL